MKKPAKPSSKTISGKVESFNISPKGHLESFMMLDHDEIVQINFPHGAGPGVAGALKVGRSATVSVKPFEDEGPSDHPVYELVPEANELKGTVKRINYALHGEPNGAILDTGEFIHMKPHGAKAVKLKLGQELVVEGEMRESPDGHKVIEARRVNGVALDARKH